MILGRTAHTTDILMITHNRPEYTRLSLSRLLETATEDTRVWVWHNGMHEETLAVVRGFSGHPRFHRFHNSKENLKLTEPTNWLWREGVGDFVGKVDDDCLVPDAWLETLRDAHEKNPKLGAVGCWHFMADDVTEEELGPRLVELHEHRILKNCWINGSGYLMKRQCIQQEGLLKKDRGFPNYCSRLAAKGWINGWHYPFLFQEHMDDPRSKHTRIRTDADVQALGGLSSQKRQIRTIQEALERQQREIREILSSSLNPRDYFGWRPRFKRIASRWRQVARSQ